MGMITLTIALPLLGALAIGFIGDDRRNVKAVALASSVAAFVASLVLVWQFDVADPNLQLVERFTWIPTIGAELALAVDGVSLVLIVLTTFLTPLILLASWDDVSDRMHAYTAAFLILQAAAVGVFAATDLLLFYVFFEFTLVPMYLLIGIWGGAGRKAAAVKFFLYTLLGGLLMLVAILYLYAQTGTFAYEAVRQVELSLTEQRWLFIAFVLAFGVKVPVFPLHTWLPDAHTEAPTGGSVFLAGILLKLGTFGLLRYALPLFPDATVELAPWLLGDRGRRHPLRRDRGADAVGHQAADRLLVGQPHGLRRARHVRPERHRHLGVRGADGQPRAVDRRAVPADRVPLRTPAHPADRGVRRAREARAGDGRAVAAGVAVVARAAGAQRVRRRVPDPARDLPDQPARRRCSPPSVRCSPRCTCCGPTSGCSTGRSRAPTTSTPPTSSPARSVCSSPSSC
jgi:hypothetical protein